MNRRRWHKLSCLVAASYGIWLLTGFTLPISLQETPDYSYKWSSGETRHPLEQFDFSQGNWRAVIVLSINERSDKPFGYAYGNVLCTSDVAVLNQLREVRFIAGESDVSTVTSGLYLLKDGKRMFGTGIVLEEVSEGMQSRDFGWIAPVDVGALHKVCGQFSRSWLPVVFY
ncbi:hypothetical protein DES53_12159 [Roseimicrobium gellanilyticum]|uniref:Uncharacterized protein n=2 Tax=Roseimicrobium gellanilyticum TaxID=748857 RepID=A0A366H2Q7_9BACT|nr:hypothetical protein DES53_12159 [Roseimicrobium gellanilyticum]